MRPANEGRRYMNGTVAGRRPAFSFVFFFCLLCFHCCVHIHTVSRQNTLSRPAISVRAVVVLCTLFQSVDGKLDVGPSMCETVNAFIVLF